MTLIEYAYKMRAIIEQAVDSLDDTTAIEAVELFKPWSGNSVFYEKDTRVKYNGVLYKCLTTHTSQETWTPTDSPSLWAEVLVQEGQILEWKQPESTNPYMLGDKVLYNGIVYVSTVDNNVWEPPVMWEVV